MIKRREFLKIGGAAAVFFLLPRSQVHRLAQAPVEVMINNTFYRGTMDGKLYTSRDQGKTWELHTYFGPDYEILDIYSKKRDQITLKVGYKRYSFLLSGEEHGKVWRTVSNT